MSAMRRRGLVVLTLAAGAIPRLAAGQGVDSATFSVMLRGDTLAVETMVRDSAHLEGELFDRLRGGRSRYSLLSAPDGSARHMESAFYRAGTDTAPVQRATFDFLADTVIGTITGAAPRRVGGSAGAVAYINPSPALVEQMIRRARLSGVGRVPVFAVSGGVLISADVRLSGDSAIIAIGAAVMRAGVDASGRLTGFVVPSQGVTATRIAGVHPPAMAARDYSAPPGAPYTATDVAITTPSGITLAGTLTRPIRSRLVPAVVLITGSGPQDRDNRIPIVPGYESFRQIADTLSRRGIAVLRLDDRGVGGSSLGPATVTTADLADDIRAAVAWLRAQPYVDGAHIALLGHSEGGLIAPMVAADDPRISALVLMASSAWRGRSVIEYQNRHNLDRDTTLSAAKRDSLMRLVRVSLDSMERVPGWVSFFMRHDPAAVARRVHAPVLILQGATDRQVTAVQADSLARAFRAGGNRRVTVRVIGETDHLFLRDSSGEVSGYAQLPSKKVEPMLLGTIADWLVSQLAR